MPTARWHALAAALPLGAAFLLAAGASRSPAQQRVPSPPGPAATGATTTPRPPTTSASSPPTAALTAAGFRVLLGRVANGWARRDVATALAAFAPGAYP